MSKAVRPKFIAGVDAPTVACHTTVCSLEAWKQVSKWAWIQLLCSFDVANSANKVAGFRYYKKVAASEDEFWWRKCYWQGWTGFWWIVSLPCGRGDVVKIFHPELNMVVTEYVSKLKIKPTKQYRMMVENGVALVRYLPFPSLMSTHLPTPVYMPASFTPLLLKQFMSADAKVFAAEKLASLDATTDDEPGWLFVVSEECSADVLEDSV